MASSTPRIDGIQSYQNIIVNGNFDFFQRGASAPVTTARSFLADRFSAYMGTGHNNATASLSTVVPTVAQSGFASTNSVLYTMGTGAATSDVGAIEHRLEGYDYAAIHSGKSARYSFWVHSSLTGTHAISLINSANNRSYVATYVINAANTWEKKFIDVVTDTAGTWLLDNGIGQKIRWPLGTAVAFQTPNVNVWQSGNFYATPTSVNVAATTGATFRIAQFMIVEGSFDANADLIFKRAGKNIQQELAMCQRYYEKSYDLDTAPGTATANGIFISYQQQGLTTTALYLASVVGFKVTKRVNGASYSAYIYDSAGNGGAGGAAKCLRGTTNVSNATNQTAAVNAGVSNVSSLFVASASGTAGNDISFHWAVDADL